MVFLLLVRLPPVALWTRLLAISRNLLADKDLDSVDMTVMVRMAGWSKALE
jgi:hypothetical protein